MEIEEPDNDVFGTPVKHTIFAYVQRNFMWQAQST